MHIKKEYELEQVSPKLFSEGESALTSTLPDSLDSDQKEQKCEIFAPTHKKCLLKFLSVLSSSGSDTQSI